MTRPVRQAAGQRQRQRWHTPPEALGLTWHDAATLVPLEAHPGGPLPFRIGAYGADGAALLDVAHRRGAFVSELAPAAPAEEDWPGEAVYAGVLWNHFGHFLLESLARAWALAALPGPILWHAKGQQGCLSAWQVAILERLGLAEREHRIIERPLRVARLAVPDMGFVARRFLHPRQAAALAVHPFRTPEPGRRVWLSRLLLPAALAHVEGEAEIEASLAARGWTILRPETLSIPEQLAALEAAAVIAGIEGSAFHSLVLGRGVRARIVIFDRGRRINPNFELVADAKGLDQRAVSLQLDHLRGEGVRASYRLARPEEALAALDAAGDGLGEGTDEHEAG